MNKFVRGGAPTVTRAQIWRKEANRIGRNGLFDLSLDAITGGFKKIEWKFLPTRLLEGGLR